MVRQRIREIVKHVFTGINPSTVEIRGRCSQRMPGLLLESGCKDKAARGTSIGRCGLPGCRCIPRYRRFEIARWELHAAYGSGRSQLGGADDTSERATFPVEPDKSQANRHTIQFHI